MWYSSSQQITGFVNNMVQYRSYISNRPEGCLGNGKYQDSSHSQYPRIPCFYLLSHCEMLSPRGLFNISRVLTRVNRQ